MHKEPKSIREVNENLIELKRNLIGAKGELSKVHVKFHRDNEKTPIAEIKAIETLITQHEELIEISKLQKENLIRDEEMKVLTERIKKQSEEITNLKQILKKYREQ